MTLICAALHAPRSSVYAAGTVVASVDGGKRGPKTQLDDDALVAAIRAVLAACPFHSEGHRKVHARLRAKAIRVGRQRVLRLMRAQHLLAPSRAPLCWGECLAPTPVCRDMGGTCQCTAS